MQIDDLSASQARRHVDPRDRPTAEGRAGKPEEPQRRTVDLGAAVSQEREADEPRSVDPAAVADKTRDEKARGQLIDLYA